MDDTNHGVVTRRLVMKLSIIGCGGRMTGMLAMVREVAADLGHEMEPLSVFDTDRESVTTRLADLGIG